MIMYSRIDHPTIKRLPMSILFPDAVCLAPYSFWLKQVAVAPKTRTIKKKIRLDMETFLRKNIKMKGSDAIAICNIRSGIILIFNS